MASKNGEQLTDAELQLRQRHIQQLHLRQGHVAEPMVRLPVEMMASRPTAKYALPAHISARTGEAPSSVLKPGAQPIPVSVSPSQLQMLKPVAAPPPRFQLPPQMPKQTAAQPELPTLSSFLNQHMYYELHLFSMTTEFNLSKDARTCLGFCLDSTTLRLHFPCMERSEFNKSLPSVIKLRDSTDGKLPPEITIGAYKFSGTTYLVSKADKNLFFGHGKITSLDKDNIIQLNETAATWLNEKIYIASLGLGRIKTRDNVQATLILSNSIVEFTQGAIVTHLYKPLMSGPLCSVLIKNIETGVTFLGTCVTGPSDDSICPFLPIEILAINGSFSLDDKFFFVNILVNKKFVTFSYANDDKLLKFAPERFWELFRCSKSRIVELTEEVNMEADMIKRCEILMNNMNNNQKLYYLSVDDRLTNDDIEMIANDRN